MSDTYFLAERFKAPAPPPVDAERFVRRDSNGHLYAVDHRVYLDEAVHVAEMEKVFRQQWVYVGMELEVPETGSFKTTYFGDAPVVIVRDEHGALHVYENICIHRGAVLVRKECGKARALECLYHRWTYDLKGRLIGVPMPGKFPASFKKQDFKLAELSRVEAFSGMIFASYQKDIEPLADYLGDIKPYVADVLNNGKIEFLGHQRYHVKANWKLFIENTVDGYHPALLHTMIFADKEYEYEPAKGESRKFINGHGYLKWPASAPPAHVDETGNMPLAFTRTRQDLGWDYSINLFPNVMALRIADIITIRQLIPRGQETVDVITSNFALLGESEEIKKHRAWMVSGQFGSAGVASMDDKFAMESVQEAARARYSDTLLLRGEYKNGVGELTTETTLRGFYEKWGRVLRLKLADESKACRNLEYAMGSSAALKSSISPVEELLLKQELADYIRYLAGLLDNFKIGEFIDEFTDNGSYQLIPRDNYEAGLPVCIIDDNKKRLRYRQRLIEKHWHFQRFRELRIISPVSMVFSSSTSASTVTNYAIYVTDSEGRSNFHVCGRFEDEFLKIGGRWRIQNRRAILDTYLPTYAIVLPP